MNYNYIKIIQNFGLGLTDSTHVTNQATRARKSKDTMQRTHLEAWCKGNMQVSPEEAVSEQLGL